jgi:DNA-binding MarR family transcriptional regulator
VFPAHELIRVRTRPGHYHEPGNTTAPTRKGLTISAPDRLGLDDQLCFALYAATTEIVRTYRPLLNELGLTYPQYLLMMALWDRDDQTITEMGRVLHLPAHGLLPVITRLVNAGLISRDPDPVDRRASRLRLTAAGAQLEQSVGTTQQAVACQTQLAPDTIVSLRTQLQNLTSSLRQPLPQPRLC